MHMRHELIVSLLMLAAAPAAHAVGSFENPPTGVAVSGASLVSGWHCSATRIEIEYDGGPSRMLAASGTDRPDTASVCGGKRNNGFGLLVNWGDLTPGTHTVRAYADGELMDTRTVTVISYGAAFLPGKAATTTVPDFPSEGRETVLEWREALQSFVAREVRAAPPINGSWYGPDMERRRNCSNAENDGDRGTYGNWQVTLDTVGDSLKMVQTGITGLSCTYFGLYRYVGNRREWYDGEYSCNDGKTGNFHSTNIEVTPTALSIRLVIKLTGFESCDIDAIIGGSRF